MNELEFEFEHEGRVVRPGQVMYVNPEYLRQAGLKAKVERYYGDRVMLRTDNGAVPTVPVSALSWYEFPSTRAIGELVLAGFPHPTNRDVAVWLAAQKARMAPPQAIEQAEKVEPMAKVINGKAYFFDEEDLPDDTKLYA